MEGKIVDLYLWRNINTSQNLYNPELIKKKGNSYLKISDTKYGTLKKDTRQSHLTHLITIPIIQLSKR